jgi:hypothetical protein
MALGKSKLETKGLGVVWLVYFITNVPISVFLMLRVLA